MAGIADFVTQNFRGPDLARVDALRRNNMLGNLDLANAQRQNAALSNPQSTPEDFARANLPGVANSISTEQQTAVKNAQSLLAQGFSAVARSPTPRATAAQFLQTPLFQKGAPLLGLDPTQYSVTAQDTDDSIRQQAIDHARALGVDPLAKQQTVVPAGAAVMQEGSNTPVYVNPKDEPQPTVHAVVGPDGKPKYVAARDAVGQTPYSPSTGNGNVNDNAKEMAYQTFLSTGTIPSIAGRSAAANVALANYVADRAASDGQTAAAAAARKQAYRGTQFVVQDFQGTKPGTAGGTLTAINTAVQHIDGLDPLIDALGTGDVKLLNRVTNTYKEQTGVPAPTNYQALKEFVGGEVAKAVLPGGGGEAERQALLAPLNAANSPQAIKAALKTIHTALAGKTEALRNQWDVGTNGTQGPFDKFLLPATQKALGMNQAQQQTASAPPEAVKFLQSHPELAPQFKAKYGYLPQ